MPIKTSGPISMSDLTREFGGTDPHSLTEFYRGGELVPSTVRRADYVDRSAPAYSTSYRAVIRGWYLGASSLTIYFGSSSPVYTLNASLAELLALTSDSEYIDHGGYRYLIGEIHSQAGNASSTELVAEYRVVRYRITTATVAVNQNVPTSGPISLTDFYGATRT